MASSFIPRAIFPPLDSLPRSYYLGHHAAGLSKMRSMLSQIDLVIECRDYRIPLTSRNPMFEESLAGRERVVVYTKKDLGVTSRAEDDKVGEKVGDMMPLVVRRLKVSLAPLPTPPFSLPLPRPLLRPQEPKGRPSDPIAHPRSRK